MVGVGDTWSKPVFNELNLLTAGADSVLDYAAPRTAENRIVSIFTHNVIGWSDRLSLVVLALDTWMDPRMLNFRKQVPGVQCMFQDSQQSGRLSGAERAYHPTDGFFSTAKLAQIGWQPEQTN
ncbi:MAG: hypothetical protein IPP45_13010 [Sphingomonadales bacterium]|nr:hypothetical protein [Sphingomonadales bacterium]